MKIDATKKNSGRVQISIIGDAIHSETIRKELLHFHLNEVYMLSPSAIKILTNKPSDPPILIKDYKPLHKEIAKRDPITTSSIYGWDTKPLMRNTDRRFHHPKLVTEITKNYGKNTNAPKDATKKA